VIDGDRVYVIDETGVLHCVQAGTSNVLWKKDTSAEFDVAENRFGVAATPMVVDDLLLLIVGGGKIDSSSHSSTKQPTPNGSAMVALDKETGEIVYAVGNHLADYASPVTAKINGVDLVLALLRDGLVATAANSGEILAHFPWQAKDLMSVNAATPVVVGNEVFVSSAFGQGSALLRVEPTGFVPVWKDASDSDEKRFEAYFSTPVFHDGYLYGCSGQNSHDAVLRCIKWSTGEVMWSQDGLNRVSLILAGGKLICLTEYGELLLVNATPEAYQLASQASLPLPSTERLPPEVRVPGLLEYPCWAAPVLSRGFLYLRSANRLVCLDLVPSERDRGEEQVIASSDSSEALSLDVGEQTPAKTETNPIATDVAKSGPDTKPVEPDQSEAVSKVADAPSADVATRANEPASVETTQRSREPLLIGFREWTTTNGKKGFLAVVSATKDEVLFRKTSGDNQACPMAVLSKADQTFIAIAIDEKRSRTRDDDATQDETLSR